MKKIVCICLAALVFFTGCSKPLSKNSQSVLEEKKVSQQQKEPRPSMRDSISQFSSDLCFTVEDGFRDVAIVAGGVLYCVAYIFTSDPCLEYSDSHGSSYPPYIPSPHRTNGNAPYMCQ